jgi:signal transduction histidine kinase
MSPEEESSNSGVSEPRGSLAACEQAIVAATSYACSIHSVRRHLADISSALADLLRHDQIRNDARLFKIARGAHAPLESLRGLLDRLHLACAPVEPLLTPLKPSELVERVRSHTEPDCRRRGVHFVNAVSSELPPARISSMLMLVALSNIVRNSVEANARVITVRGRLTTVGVPGVADEEAIELRFDDDGAGIPKEHWRDVFRLFFSLNKKQGSGVGLAVSRDIIDRHRGDIRVASSEPGGGTSIAVTWPL